MADQMVLETQVWLNATYKGRVGWMGVPENGLTGWDTIYGLIHALQIELGITETADNFGPGTEARFNARWPEGILQQSEQDSSQDNVYAIIQGSLWCKGYSTGSHITRNFYDGTGGAVRKLKEDMGFGDGSTVTLEIMKALLSMRQFVLLEQYGANPVLREMQQAINRDYRDYTGIIPTDGLYGREMNTAIIQVLQALEGFTPEEATGNFGEGTTARLITINRGNASTYPEWLWLGRVVLTANGFPVYSSAEWDDYLGESIRDFQSRYKIPVTGELDPATWMSLLVSHGDKSRTALACDTRFEITSERLKVLKKDGYEIVGRYLSEIGQEDLNPNEYWKAIRPGELERITEGGMKFFPIFQHSAREFSDFTKAKGEMHARLAREAADRLGIPPTYIYFAVDFDAISQEVEDYIVPYFRAVNNNIQGGYRVGIYGSRNVCSMIIDRGLAGSAFVADLSYGFSGNLGFPLPEKWNYDQFHEISDYRGQGWDLDKVAYSGLVPPVSYVTPRSMGGAEVVQEVPDYRKLGPVDLIWHLEARFEELRAQGDVGVDVIVNPAGEDRAVRVATWRCVLNYLAKDYLRDGGNKGAVMWSIAAESLRHSDALAIEEDDIAGKIIGALDRYIANPRQSMVDGTGENVDLSHLSATTLGYIGWDLIPDHWTGWAGDLATAMAQIQKIVDWNPGANLAEVSAAMVGPDENFRSDPVLEKLLLSYPADGSGDIVENHCNRDDLCCDGDAIVIARELNSGDDDDPHLLSNVLRSYYTDAAKLKNRFKEIALSVGAADVERARSVFYASFMEDKGPIYLRVLAEGVRDDVVSAACDALAFFVFN